MKAAHAIWNKAKSMGQELSVVAVPKTMDNDILWVWQSFGFLSAVERAKEAIQQLNTEIKSNSRLCIIQLFGSDSGFVVSHAALASGVCDLFLIPEVPFTFEKISDYIIDKIKKKCNKARLKGVSGIIVMSETAIPQDYMSYIDESYVGLSNEEKVEICSYMKAGRALGRTPDALRTGGLKLVARTLQEKIRQIPGEFWNDYQVITNEPRQIIRSISPSTSDIIFGQRLGSLAVDCAMAGFTDFMISQWLTEYVMVPLRLVVLGRKRIPQSGIFLKSVRAMTGQPVTL